MSSPASSTADAGGAWSFRDGRAGRFGLLFAGVWLVFLVDSLRTSWRLAWGERDVVSGWVGMAATIAFAASYLAVFSWIRARRRRLQLQVPAREAWAMIAGLCALMLVMIARHRAGGHRGGGVRRGGRRDVPVVVDGARVHRRARRRGRGLGSRGARLVRPGRPDVRGLHRGLRDVGRHPADGAQRRAAAGARGERPARGRRRAQPLRPGPARHPRPLADRHHGQGRAGATGCSTSTRSAPGPSSRTSSDSVATRSPTCGGRSRATAT